MSLDISQLPSQKGGFIAEEFHAESFNLDAILKDKDFKAINAISTSRNGTS